MTDKTLGLDRKSQIDFIEEYMKQKHKSVYKGGDIANYGTIPLFKSENEFNFFGHKLDLIFDNTRKKIMGKGQLRSFASELTRLKVGIPEDLSNKEKNISKEICKKTSFETTNIQ